MSCYTAIFCMSTALSQEENAMGRFLKSKSQEDKTRAGKMMAAVGKAQSFSSQQRLVIFDWEWYLICIQTYEKGRNNYVLLKSVVNIKFPIQSCFMLWPHP